MGANAAPNQISLQEWLSQQSHTVYSAGLGGAPGHFLGHPNMPIGGEAGAGNAPSHLNRAPVQPLSSAFIPVHEENGVPMVPPSMAIGGVASAVIGGEGVRTAGAVGVGAAQSASAIPGAQAAAEAAAAELAQPTSTPSATEAYPVQSSLPPVQALQQPAINGKNSPTEYPAANSQPPLSQPTSKMSAARITQHEGGEARAAPPTKPLVSEAVLAAAAAARTQMPNSGPGSFQENMLFAQHIEKMLILQQQQQRQAREQWSHQALQQQARVDRTRTAVGPGDRAWAGAVQARRGSGRDQS